MSCWISTRPFRFCGSLDHHHGVGTVRQRRTGGDPRDGAGAHGEPGHVAGQLLADQLAPACAIGRDHRIAIHRGGGERGQIFGRDDGLGQDEPARLGQRYMHRRQYRRGIENTLQCFLDGDAIGGDG